MSKEAIIDLIDNVDESEFDLLYHVILKFVKAVPPLPDEIEAIELGEAAYEKGEIYSHEDVWA